MCHDFFSPLWTAVGYMDTYKRVFSTLTKKKKLWALLNLSKPSHLGHVLTRREITPVVSCSEQKWVQLHLIGSVQLTAQALAPNFLREVRFHVFSVRYRVWLSSLAALHPAGTATLPAPSQSYLQQTFFFWLTHLARSITLQVRKADVNVLLFRHTYSVMMRYICAIAIITLCACMCLCVCACMCVWVWVCAHVCVCVYWSVFASE